MTVIGLLHPGSMGAAVGRALRLANHDVRYASQDRSPDSIGRADKAGLTDAHTPAALAAACDVILSICPPDAALVVAQSVADTETAGGAGFSGTYVDANAVSPGTARVIADVIESGGGRYVDGGIIGGPPDPDRPGQTRLYLSGARAGEVAALFTESGLDARVVDGPAGSASALKMCYAAWTKGTAALLLAIQETARAEGIGQALLDEWAISQPQLGERVRAAAGSAADKGWRWTGEMDEIADTFITAGQPGGFHRAAAEMFARHPRPSP